MNWRPKDWGFPKDEYLVTPEICFEAGADAILEALRKDGYRLDMENLGCSFTKDTGAELGAIRWWAYEQVADSNRGQGYAVFIPDEGA